MKLAAPAHVGDEAAFRRRLEELRERVHARLVAAELPVDALEDLQSTLEELQVVQEELRAQNDELLATRGRVEEERRRYQELFDTAPVGYVVTDATGHVEEMNVAAEVILGRPRGELVGKPAVLMVALSDRRAFRNELARLRSGEAEQLDDWEIRLSRRGGEEFPAALAVRPVHDAERGLVGLRWVVRDVTERKRFERQLEQQAGLAATGQLAAGIAHDFNNILAAVLAFADLLRRDTTLPESARAKLHLIAGQARRGSQLVRQILDFGLGTRNEREPVRLVGFLQELVRLLERTMPENITVTLTLPDEECIVEADPAKLQQVLVNLAVNARDAMPAGGGLGITLSTVSLAPGEPPPVTGMPAWEWAVLTVSDTGTGMTPEIRRHIFEPFFTTKGPDKGSGLGLAQAHGIVTQHGGWMRVRSEPDAGTTFDLYLPLRDVERALPADERETVPRGGGEVVLLVEDYAAVSLGSAEMLAHLGYRVLRAERAEQALELWKRHRDRIAVVLTDIGLPGMGGGDLCRALRRQGARVPVIVMSGYPPRPEAQAGELGGVTGWLGKPVEMRELAEAVRRAVHGGPRP